MGLLDWLSPAVNATAQTVSAFGAADDARAKAKQNAVIQQIQLARQQKEDALKEALGQSTISKNNAEVGNYTSEAQDRLFKQQHQPVDPNSPDVLTRKQQLGIEENRQKVKDENQFGYHAPVASYEHTDITDPVTGQVHVGKFNRFTGKTEDTGFTGKQPKGSGGSASGAQVPVADMKQRYSEIVQQAQGLARGDWNITKGMQAREGVDYGVTRENASGHPNLLHSLTQGGFGALNVGGDDYQHYQALMNSTRALGDDVAKVFKGRQNEEAVNREVALSQLTATDYQNPQVVQQKLSRLQHIIDLAEQNNPQQAGLGGSSAPQAPGIDPVLAEFGIGLVKKK